MVAHPETVRVVTLDDLIGALTAEPLTNREIACIHARFALFRKEVADRIRRRILADPLEPIEGEQRLIRTLDRMIAALDRTRPTAPAVNCRTVPQ
jgi:hypothetical protein